MSDYAMSGGDRIEDRARPVLVVSAWALALPVGAIVCLHSGHTAIGGLLTLNAIALGWCDI